MLALPAAVLTGLAFATPIIAFSATQRRDSGFNVLFRFGITPLFLFSGTFFPLDQLPRVAAAARLPHAPLPRRRAVPGARTRDGRPDRPRWRTWSALLGFVAAGTRPDGSLVPQAAGGVSVSGFARVVPLGAASRRAGSSSAT